MSANKFAISAKTCTLKYNNQKGQATILGNEDKYTIPIYQRPYSWNEEQLRKFISDIFTSFWGNEGSSDEEPMFIGTMQLSAEQEIIDGQQRLTTLLIFFKVLKQEFPNSVELKRINLNWLCTKVNNGEQQKYLDEFVTGNLPLDDESLNPYLKNAFFIRELINEQTKDEEGQPLSFNIENFIKHLLTNIYFVIIETHAGLSKTLQIFDAINTTGLDLNGGDIFKIRMYEYLKDKKGKDENAFNEISQLYQDIDKKNYDTGRNVTNIRGILNIYQYILIAKYSLPVTLYGYGTDTFFEQLFDTTLNVNQWKHFKNNVSNLELSIEDIKKIIEVRYKFQNNGYKTCEDACAMNFIWLSRYGKYWILTFVFLYKFKDEADCWNKLMLYMRQLSKVYIIYSIRFRRSINDVKTFTYSLIKEIINGSFEDVMNTLNKKIGKLENHKGWGDLENTLNGNIVDNAKIKNIICRLSAMLEENYRTEDKTQISEINKNLFSSKIDIEHIQSYYDRNGDRREDIWNYWKEDINSIGNLMILERRKNRSISNKPYGDKITQYEKSKFSIVRKQPNKYPSWDLEKCKSRKEKEVEKILNYIFD